MKLRNGLGIAALVVIVACTPQTDGAADTEAAATTNPPPASVNGSEQGSWFAQNQESLDEATSEMTRFADAVEAGELGNAQDSASRIRRVMTTLAESLDDATTDEALTFRADLVDCGVAYGAVEDALAASDGEALTAAAPLVSQCLGLSNLYPVTTATGPED